jgi:hypothetical protein
MKIQVVEEEIAKILTSYFVRQKNEIEDGNIV